MSADESSGSSRPTSLPVATALEKPGPRRPGAPADGGKAGPRGIVIDPRVLLVGGGVALIGIAVFALFLWMVPNAAAREAQAACRSLQQGRDVQQHDGLLVGALCPDGKRCAPPVKAPDFTAKDVTGKDVTLSEAYRGKVVLINFWASWCGVCKTEKPALAAMAAEMASDDFKKI
jgi:hypothetical protein